MTRKKIFSKGLWTVQLKFAQACEDSNISKMQQLIKNNKIWKETVDNALFKSAETANVVSFQFCLDHVEFFTSVNKFCIVCETLVRKQQNAMLHLLLDKQKPVKLCRLNPLRFSCKEIFHLQQYRYTLQRVVALAISSNDRLLFESVFQLDGFSTGDYLDCFDNFLSRYLYFNRWDKQHVPFARIFTKKLYHGLRDHRIVRIDIRFTVIAQCFNEPISNFEYKPLRMHLHRKRQRQTQLIMFDQDATSLALGLAQLGLPRLLLCHLATSCTEPFGNVVQLHDLWMILDACDSI